MELTIEEIISLFNERELNYKTNNYLVTDLDSLARQKIISGIEKEIIIKPLDDNSFDELYIKMHNVLVDLKDIPVKDLFAYLLEALNIPDSISFDDKFSILRYRGLLRECQKASSIILYNGENLEDKDRALLNEIYGFNTTFFNVNDLLMSSYFSFYQTSSGLFLDSRENYTRVRAR